MSEAELHLLRSFEPVVRFTSGEYFFPVAVDRYASLSTLWRDPRDGESDIVAAAGTFDLAGLLERSQQSQGLGYSLSAVVNGEREQRVRLLGRDRPPRLRGSSRLAAVGLLGRSIDSLNRLSLIFRGSVPGGSAARSYLIQQEHLAPDLPVYYGRVLRDGGWVICQYWYFYAFNNWRSAFGGVNEHEGDWEQVTIYLDGTSDPGPDGLPPPRWVVFSAHDEVGDDLRRRWDDPDLGVVGGRHPVVYAGAGSHSGAYLPGDYLITVEPPTLGGVVNVVRWVTRQLTPWSSSQEDVGIPYVDYARGDGRAIGPGEDESWHPVLIGEGTPWVRDYRGLWGHDTRDRLGGERGPAGPRYERDGSVRHSWADPVGWAGLAKVAPGPEAERALMQQRVEHLDVQLAEVDLESVALRAELSEAAAGMPPSSPEVRALGAKEQRLHELRMEATRLRDEHHYLRALADRPLRDVGPHDHLGRRRLPLEAVSGFRGRFLSWWAVLSTPLLMWMLALVVHPEVGMSATATAVFSVAILYGMEGLARGQFIAALLRVATVAGAVVGLVLLWRDWQVVVGLALAIAAFIVLIANLREALRR
jgi:hypothetical protein